MIFASTKHALRADLRPVAVAAALLGCAATLALPTSGALADTTSSAGTTAAPAPAAPAAAPAQSGASSGGTTAGTTSTGKPTIATWFGPGFYGNKTACGQTMNSALVGVASRTLACGTLVQIGYHGHSVTVPVVDRGPYGHIGAMWDLTAGAARALKVKETVRVTTAIVGSLPNTPSLGEPLEPGLPSSSTPASATAAAAATATGGAAAA